jgi:hypothetical protein
MPSAGILASRNRFRISFEIINALFASMRFDGDMKRYGEQLRAFRLALAAGLVLMEAANQPGAGL